MDLVATLFLPLSLAFIMLAMGLALVPADFKRVVAEPRAAIAGLVAQMVLLPGLALLIVSVWPLTPAFAVGVMILAACPGGITSNLLTHLARGDTALSVSLTAVTSLAGVLTVPLIVNGALVFLAGAGETVDVPVGRMVGGVFAISTVPLILGMAIRHRVPALADRLERPARHVATALFALIVAGTFAGQWHNITAHLADAGPAVLALNVGAMAIGSAGARTLRLDRRQGIAIALECGLQNVAMAMFVAATLLGSEAMMVPAIVYALIMNVTAAVFIAALTLPARRAMETR